MSSPDWDVDMLRTDECLNEPVQSVWSGQRVPPRLAHIAEQAMRGTSPATIESLAGLSLAEMTGKVREIEQRALQLARDEGRDEFRVKELLQNLAQQGAYAPGKSPGALGKAPPTDVAPAKEASPYASAAITTGPPGGSQLQIRVIPDASMADGTNAWSRAGAATLTMRRGESADWVT